MPSYCTNITWLDGQISSIRKVEKEYWMVGADIKSDNWKGKGGYRSAYHCPSK